MFADILKVFDCVNRSVQLHGRLYKEPEATTVWNGQMKCIGVTAEMSCQTCKHTFSACGDILVVSLEVSINFVLYLNCSKSNYSITKTRQEEGPC